MFRYTFNQKDVLTLLLVFAFGLVGCAGGGFGEFSSLSPADEEAQELHDQNREIVAPADPSGGETDPVVTPTPTPNPNPNPTPTKSFCSGALVSLGLQSTASAPYLIIQNTDPSAFTCLKGKGVKKREIPRDSCDGDGCLITDAYVFDAHYSDGTKVEMQVEKATLTSSAARTFALKAARAMGRIPSSLRAGVREGKIFYGSGGAYSDIAKFFIATDYIDQRVAQGKLAHTMFHEAIHAVWEDTSLSLNSSTAWLEAQASDGCYLTKYGQSKPSREDMAETALIAFALQFRPSRIPASDTKVIEDEIPARLAFLSSRLPKAGDPLFVNQGAVFNCSQ